MRHVKMFSPMYGYNGWYIDVTSRHFQHFTNSQYVQDSAVFSLEPNFTIWRLLIPRFSTYPSVARNAFPRQRVRIEGPRDLGLHLQTLQPGVP